MRISCSVSIIKRLIVFKVSGAYCNRYKHVDSIIMRMANYIGVNNLHKIKSTYIINKIPLLQLLISLFIMKSKVIYDDTSFLPNVLFEKSKSKYLHYSIADWLLRHRDYSDKTESHFIFAQHKNKEININLRYSDFISQKYGYKSDKLKRIVARLTSVIPFSNLSKSQKLRLVVILYQQNRCIIASNIVKELGKNFVITHTTSPYIFNKIMKNGVYKDPYIYRGSKQYQEILMARVNFTKMITRSADSFCIVGNAPTELNTGNGKFIDSKKLVIRINNYSIDYPEDYGTKQDIWIRVANNEVDDERLKHNNMVIFSANNFAIKRRDANKYLLAPYLMEKNYTIIPNNIYQKLIKELDGLPSTGLAISYWIYSIIGKIPKDFLFGFSHFHQDKSFNTHYFQDDVTSGTHLHEWNKEKFIFDKITR